MDDQFYVYLPSNDSSFTDNKISNFRTQLAKSHSLRGNWEVALTHISCFKSWRTFSDSKCCIRKFFGFQLKGDPEFTIPGIVANSEEELVDYINGVIEFNFNLIEDPSKSVRPKVSFNHKERIFEMTTGYGEKSDIYILEFEDNLRDLFGFKTYEKVFDGNDKRNYFNENEMAYYTESGKRNSKHVKSMSPEEANTIDITADRFKKALLAHISEVEKENEKLVFGAITKALKDNAKKKRFMFISVRTVAIENLYRNIFVYCDIVMPSFLGHYYSKILRIVDIPANASYGAHINKQFDKLYYVPVAVNDFTTIEIDIKDEFGKNVAFEFGTCIVTLHFRKAK